MRPARALALALALVACGGGGSSDDGFDASPDGTIPIGSLGLDDVSILLPLPPSKEAPTLVAMTGAGAGTEMVPRDLFTRLVVVPGDVLDAYEDFHVVAIRFDLCDREAPGACPPGGDGRLRLVFQPMFVESSGVDTNDVALHAFYSIPAADMPDVIAELRTLAGIGGTPATAPLGVTTAIDRPGYRDRLRTLVTRYATAPRLSRLTLFAQNAMSAAFNWAFRGVELHDGSFQDIVIPGVAATQQRAILVGSQTTYDTMPVADAPAGFALAIDGDRFAAATAPERAAALEAMTAILNPRMHSATTVQCIGCHVSTFLTARRAMVAGVDPTTLPGRFTSAYDLSTGEGISTQFDRSLRAFGYFFAEPAISQRVVNDTAQTLVEIEQQYPQ